MLSIEAWDYDDFFGDDLIGKTKIDFDDRWYSKEWISCVNKPVETRDLYIPTSQISQGRIKMWVEILNMESKKSEVPPLDITPEPVKEFECRFIVWETKDIEMMDFEGTSDVFIKSFFDADYEYRTDTHWRCTTGKASFNWRNKIIMKSKQPDYKLTIEAWDRDIIASDDLIGQRVLDVGPMFEDVYITGKLKALSK